MNIVLVVQAQYRAALEMLRQAIVQCPPEVWDDPQDKDKYWHIAYHTLFYAHLYLQTTRAEFVPWSKHRAHYNTFTPPDEVSRADEAYTRDEALDYLEVCLAQVAERVPQLDWSAASGFDWLPFDKLELQFYSIRHIQQHAGQLMERLSARTGIEVNWVGTRPA
jgi:hypothetical protein